MGRQKRRHSQRKDTRPARQKELLQTKKRQFPHKSVPSSSSQQHNPPAVAAAALEDSSEEEDAPTDYELLLHALQPPGKKRRLEERREEKDEEEESAVAAGSGDDGEGSGDIDLHQAVEEGEGEEKDKVMKDTELSDSDSDHSDLNDSEDHQKDPFCEHVERDLGEDKVKQLKETFSKPLEYKREEHPTLGLVSTATCLPKKDTTIISCDRLSMERLYVKQHLANLWSPAMTGEDGTKKRAATATAEELFSPLQANLFVHMNSYKDLLFTRRTFTNGEEIRRTYLLHALNHVLKTRSRVLKNNAKLSLAAKEDNTDLELRDQGLTRPKVLIVVPFREAALKTLMAITSLLLTPGKGQVSHRKRFMEEFHEEEHLPSKVPKPASYKEMFAGNIDDCFRVGVSIKRNTVRLYSKFYSSDIIIASPLGLRTIIGAEGEKERDFDFLSSLEIVIVDQADVYLMQNWDHLLHIFSHLHLQPRESHGTDFSRVRMWSIDGLAKYYRQTLVFSSFATPEINSLFNTHCQNYAGKVKVSDVRQVGSISHVALQVPQTFHRITCQSHLDLPEDRWKYFIDKVLPECSRDLMKQTVIFIPSYFDFVRLRNHMRREEINFVPLSEHTSSSDVSRGRSNFFHGHTHFLLYTERMHFFKRYHIRGIKHLVFYSLPMYAEFYSELVNMLQEGVGQVGGATCTVLYSTYDSLSLGRIVGTGRAARLIKSSEHIQTLISGSQ